MSNLLEFVGSKYFFTQIRFRVYWFLKLVRFCEDCLPEDYLTHFMLMLQFISVLSTFQIEDNIYTKWVTVNASMESGKLIWNSGPGKTKDKIIQVTYFILNFLFFPDVSVSLNFIISFFTLLEPCYCYVCFSKGTSFDFFHFYLSRFFVSLSGLVFASILFFIFLELSRIFF